MEEELQQIIVKATKLYGKYGVKSITMDDLAKELGISKKTIYKYVNNKDELIEKAIEFHEEENDKLLSKIFSSKLNAIQQLLYVNQIMIKMLKDYNPNVEYDLKKYHSTIFNKYKKLSNEKIFKSVLNNLKQGKKEGLYRREMDEELIAKLYVLRIDSLMDSSIITRDEALTPVAMKQLMEYHIRGISNEKGIMEYDKYKNKQIENFN